jgi:cell division protein FtsB
VSLPIIKLVWILRLNKLCGSFAVATAALRSKKTHEAELDRLAGTRLQLEMQVNTLESANLNAETMAAMKKASEALGTIHGNLYVFYCYQEGEFCSHICLLPPGRSTRSMLR